MQNKLWFKSFSCLNAFSFCVLGKAINQICMFSFCFQITFENMIRLLFGGVSVTVILCMVFVWLMTVLK